ncbi:hypothetical protein [Streptomyces sp. MH60]|uniref:hypothetical protein n=1 Tax=Streptomyces sp. MH60 TaxID=1940758 RepID=UPI000D453D97|nr:hypothetical protein [Streptomyces sp. MH60]PPS85385.1 hypothetical protein BZZ08_03937 [Streptomyces sp. MH60]
MTHRSRPRVHLLTGGPDWEQRRATVKPVPFSRRQKEARKPLLALMQDLCAAIERGDWASARAARSAAWGEVNRLADNLTTEERKQLWRDKRRIVAGEARDRARRAGRG